MAGMELNFTPEEKEESSNEFSYYINSMFETSKLLDFTIPVEWSNMPLLLFLNIFGQNLMNVLTTGPEGYSKDEFRNYLKAELIPILKNSLTPSSIGGAVIGMNQQPSNVQLLDNPSLNKSFSATNNKSNMPSIKIDVLSASNPNVYFSSIQNFKELLPKLFIPNDFFSDKDIEDILSKINTPTGGRGKVGRKMIGGTLGEWIGFAAVAIILAGMNYQLAKPSTSTSGPGYVQRAKNWFTPSASPTPNPNPTASPTFTGNPPFNTEVAESLNAQKESLADISDDLEEILADLTNIEGVVITTANASESINAIVQKILPNLSQLSKKIDLVFNELETTQNNAFGGINEEIVAVRDELNTSVDNSTAILLKGILNGTETIVGAWTNTNQRINALNTTGLENREEFQIELQSFRNETKTNSDMLLEALMEIKTSMNKVCEPSPSTQFVCPAPPENMKQYVENLKGMKKQCDDNIKKGEATGVSQGRMIGQLEIQILQERISEKTSQIDSMSKELANLKLSNATASSENDKKIADLQVNIDKMKDELVVLYAEYNRLLSYIYISIVSLFLSYVGYYAYARKMPKWVKTLWDNINGKQQLAPSSAQQTTVIAAKYNKPPKETVMSANQRRSNSVDKRAKAREEALAKEAEAKEKKRLEKLNSNQNSNLTPDEEDVARTLASFSNYNVDKNGQPSSNRGWGGRKRKTRKTGKRVTKRRQLRNKRRTGKKMLKKSKKYRK